MEALAICFELFHFIGCVSFRKKDDINSTSRVTRVMHVEGRVCHTPILFDKVTVNIHGVFEFFHEFAFLVTARDFYKDMNTQDYYHITLTDEEDVPEAIGKLRTIYPNIMRLDYDNTRTRTNNAVTEIENIELKSPLELFKEFYVIRNNQDMSPEQEKLAMDLIEKIWEDA